MTDSNINIYTDGACKPNPGPGGWGAVIIRPDAPLEKISGSIQHTTNNRMEIQAAIQALKAVKESLTINIFSDSQYLKKGVGLWLPAWQKNGWLTVAGTDVKNTDLWKELARTLKKHRVCWHWVKGHDNNKYNEMADMLARSAISKDPLPLQDKKAIHIFTSISVNKAKQGSWSAILKFQDKIKPLAGAVANTTGNRMHIHAAIAGLATIKRPMPIHIYTFSGYLRDGASNWARQWSNNSWQTKEGLEVKHRDLWEQLNDLNKRYKISWHLAEKIDPPCEMQEAKLMAQEVLLKLTGP